jgi:hypothetical protein
MLSRLLLFTKIVERGKSHPADGKLVGIRRMVAQNQPEKAAYILFHASVSGGFEPGNADFPGCRRARTSFSFAKMIPLSHDPSGP